MKKTLFVWLLLAMGVVMTGCSGNKENGEAAEAEEVENAEGTDAAAKEFVVNESASPADQMASLITQFVDMIKATHISSEADVENLKTQTEKFEAAVASIQQNLEAKMEGMSEADKLQFAVELLSMAEKNKDLEAELETEIERLKSEAAAAGVNVDDLDFE